jgi:hypothetical protein
MALQKLIGRFFVQLEDSGTFDLSLNFLEHFFFLEHTGELCIIILRKKARGHTTNTPTHTQIVQVTSAAIGRKIAVNLA